MKKIMLFTILMLFGLISICEANPIIVGIERVPDESTKHSELPDWLAVFLSYLSVTYIESMILLIFLHDFRVLWACPYANAVSTIPGFLLSGKLGINATSPILTLTCIIIIYFLVSVLVESSLMVAVVKKLPLRDTLISILFANATTYLLIVAFVPLGFFHLNI